MVDDERWDSSRFWQQQHHLARLSRENSGVPHGYARQAALASKTYPQASAALAAATLADVAIQLVKQHRERDRPATPARVGGPSGQEKREQLEEERMRHINEDIHHQFWTALDLSGQGLLTVSPRIVQYDFLQRLFLNNNRLNHVPAAITRMDHLRVLDISGNDLTELPAEIGLMKNLRYLFAFDNHIATLPYELGQLFRLEMLGIEGNPWCTTDESEAARAIFAKEGTRGLILDLRDRAPVGRPPQPREWMQTSSEQCDLSMISYNTLCDRYATPNLYGYTPAWALAWEYRSQLLVEEVLAQDSDLVCLQEVNSAALEELWAPVMEPRGYRGLFYPKTRARTMENPEDARQVDGCVIFYRTPKLRLLEKIPVEMNSKALLKEDLSKSVDTFNRVMIRDNVALIAVFDVGGQLLVLNTSHLHWDPAYRDVKLVQTAILLEETEKVVAKYASSSTPEGSRWPRIRDPKQVPVVFCGDFNSTADSGVFQLVNQGSVPPTHEDMQGYSYGRYTTEGISHRLPLKSAYPEGMELPFTNYTPDFVETVDYIFYSTPTLHVSSLLGPVDKDYIKRYTGFPNAHHPSDHIPIAAQFSFRSKRDGGDAK